MDSLPEGIVRAKGVLSVVDDVTEGAAEAPRPMVLQRVGLRWSLRPSQREPQSADSRCVFIGMRGSVDREWIGQQLR